MLQINISSQNHKPSAKQIQRLMTSSPKLKEATNEYKRKRVQHNINKLMQLLKLKRNNDLNKTKYSIDSDKKNAVFDH